jgi:hypothetical protein
MDFRHRDKKESNGEKDLECICYSSNGFGDLGRDRTHSDLVGHSLYTEFGCAATELVLF